jgi:DNA-binding NarL/FixJ family response regulator
MNENHSPRVVLLARTALFAEAVSRSLESASIPVTTILGTASSSVESLAEIKASVALVEANGTVADTAAMLHRIQLVSSLPVVIIGAEASDAELVELIEAGCCGCVRRDAALADLLDAIRDVCCSRAECSPYLAALVSSRIRALSRDFTGSLETPALTPREAEVLRLAARGLSNKDIAQQLRIWSQTVKSHLHNVYNRLGVRTRRAAVAKALRLGLIREQ